MDAHEKPLAALVAPDILDLLEESPTAIAAETEEMHPADLADVAKLLPKEKVRAFLAALPAARGADVLEYLDEELRSEFLEEIPTELHVRGADDEAADQPTFIHDFSLRLPASVDETALLPHVETIEKAIAAVLDGQAENDAFNQLVLVTQTDPQRREVDVRIEVKRHGDRAVVILGGTVNDVEHHRGVLGGPREWSHAILRPREHHSAGAAHPAERRA